MKRVKLVIRTVTARNKITGNVKTGSYPILYNGH